ncbi:MAG: Hsp33 family molecular chaperone HslO [Pseudohongiellaceae bacterium]
MKNPDQSQRFLFEEHPIRGQYVSLDESWQEIRKQSGLTGRGLSLLGEALAAVTLLVDTLKIKGSITLQIRGKGPLELLVVEANSEHKVRGIARSNGEIDENIDLPQVFGSDHLVITIKTEGAEPHQGIAPLLGATLASALEHYFATSEQLPTHFWLACDDVSTSGMLIQKLPGKAKDDDAWDRILHLANTVTAHELLSLPLGGLVYRLFNEETVRLFDPNRVEFSCSCSRERTAGMLTSLGQDEVNDILKQENEISITCEFCNANYCFDSIDVQQLFSAMGTVAVDSSRH